MCEGAAPAIVSLTAAGGALAALKLQLITLGALSDRLNSARLLIPPARDLPTWTGLAAAAYRHSLYTVEQQLAVATTRLDDAIAETGRAVETLGE